MTSQISLLKSFAKENKLELPNDFIDNISEFCKFLLEANKSTNLVSKNDSEKLLTRHVADSLVFAAYVGNCIGVAGNISTWVDIGSGAGFPVIPLCLYFKHIKFFATESRKKRCEFLNEAKRKLDLQNLEIIQGRTESSDLKNIDIVSCRAVGSAEEDFKLAKKLLKKDGSFLTLKSKRIIDEMQEKNSKLLEQAKIWSYRLPQEEMEYALLNLKLSHN